MGKIREFLGELWENLFGYSVAKAEEIVLHSDDHTPKEVAWAEREIREQCGHDHLYRLQIRAIFMGNKSEPMLG